MKLSRVLGAVVAAAGLLAGTVYAKEEIQIMQTITNQKQLEIYVKAPELPETFSIQIGRDSCEDVQIVDLQEDQKKIQTFIFLDNSLSITEGNREKIKGFLNNGKTLFSHHLNRTKAYAYGVFHVYNHQYASRRYLGYTY